MSLSIDARRAVLRATRRVIVVWAVTLSAAAMASAAPSATWTTQTTPGLSGPPDAALTSVSCVSAAFCMAVGSADYGLDSTQEPLGPETSAERWDGSSWTVIPTPVAGSNPELEAVSCASAAFCVAVGQNAGNGFMIRNARALLETWNGASWTRQATPAGSVPGSRLAGVSCVSSSFCIAVGAPVSVVWKGSSWKKIKIPAVRYHSELSAILCLAASDCTAVGSYSLNKTGVEELAPLAERWNGHHWTVDRPPSELDRYRGKLYPNNTWLTAISCLSRSFCLASGDAQRAQNGIYEGAYAERWDGTRWTRAVVGLPTHSPFNGISCLSSTDCFAAGQFDTGIFPAPSTQQPLVETWNGVSWTRTAVPRVPTEPGSSSSSEDELGIPALSSISCARRAGCTAVGSQVNGSDVANLAQSDIGAPDAAPAARDHPGPTSVRDRRDDVGHGRQISVRHGSAPPVKNENGRRSGAAAPGHASNPQRSLR
jgi:hypothetical protein